MTAAGGPGTAPARPAPATRRWPLPDLPRRGQPVVVLWETPHLTTTGEGSRV